MLQQIACLHTAGGWNEVHIAVLLASLGVACAITCSTWQLTMLRKPGAVTSCDAAWLGTASLKFIIHLGAPRKWCSCHVDIAAGKLC
jgi:hypothetical protein